MIAEKNIFFNLPLANLETISDGFSLNTDTLEKEMVSRNGGVQLNELKLEDNLVAESDIKKYVPFFRNYDDKTIRELAGMYPEVNYHCSMMLESAEEVVKHMSVGYQVAHFHYILGKQKSIKNSFPSMCCGIASVNVAMSLMSFGYVNATYAYSREHDHGYVLLPFVINNSDIRGSIVIDPTSDQLWHNKSKRNDVFIKLGNKWEYITDWRDGSNLFPDRLLSIQYMKEISDEWDSYSDYPDYARD